MSLLVETGDLLAGIPRNLLLVGHCLYVAYVSRSSKSHFLLNYWAGFLCAFGGGITSGLLLQDPEKVPISLFSTNSIFLIWTASWWLINYAPNDVGVNCFENAFVRIVCKVFVNILRTSTIVGRADASIVRYPGIAAAPLVLGTLGGCGGKFLQDALYIGSGRSAGPSELTSPGYSWRSATFAALTYTTLVHYFGMYTPREGLALLVLFFALHTVSEEFFKKTLDFTEPIAHYLYTYLNIPEPVSVAVNGAKQTKTTPKSD